MPFCPNHPNRRTRLAVLLIALLCCLLVNLPAAAEDTGTVKGLLELLHADLAEDVILLWLDTREGETAPPSAGDLLELKKAGAGDAVLRKLLALSTDGAPPVEADTSPEPTESVTAPEDTSGEAHVSFTLSYVPEFRSDEKDWDLYVYLDGKPLTFVAPGTRLLGDDALQFEQALEPGRHQIRIAQENHDPGSRESSAYTEHFHEARMAPADLVFQLAPGTAVIEISVKRPLVDFGGGGPISYRVAQNGRVVIGEDETGGDPDGWTPVCDDAKAAGVAEPRGCRGWPTFWTVDAPPRREVLRALSLFEYRPVPINQKVH